MKQIRVKRNTYQDSFNLMLVASKLRTLPGVIDAALFMGTLANKKRLENTGYASEELELAKANDLLIAIDVADEEFSASVLEKIEEFLSGDKMLVGELEGEHTSVPQSMEEAIRNFSNPDLVSISLPGEYAGREARKAIEHGLHVFLFSDNVSLEEEVELKRLAQEKGLLMMGPDCGTARIGDNPLGFCNIVSSGEVGIVAASGTGAQEIICLLDRYGIGISHIIGTGGRDLQSSVGAITSRMGLFSLDEDPKTKLIIFVSKPADVTPRENLVQLSKKLTKPVIFCFIGDTEHKYSEKNGCIFAQNLYHAAQLALSITKGNALANPLTIEEFKQTHKEVVDLIRKSLAPGQKYIRGLYSGGSLADETAQILALNLSSVHAGSGFGDVLPIQNLEISSGHTIIDLGDDFFTHGTPHPMIDFSTRIKRFRQEVKDTSVAVILLDIVLGTNANPDPSFEMVDEIIQAKRNFSSQGLILNVIVHICGTDKDSQNYSKQVARFKQAGCWVFGSNVEAAMAATCLVSSTE